MPTTPNSGYPYPAATDAPDGPGAIYALASAIDAVANWTDYEPGFNLSTFTGFVRWRLAEKVVYINGRIIAATGFGMDASSIRFNLPTAVPASALRGIPFSSRVVFTDVSVNTSYAGEVRILDRYTAQLFSLTSTTPGVILTNASVSVPFAWAVGDYMDIDFAYSID